MTNHRFQIMILIDRNCITLKYYVKLIQLYIHELQTLFIQYLCQYLIYELPLIYI